MATTDRINVEVERSALNAPLNSALVLRSRNGKFEFQPVVDLFAQGGGVPSFFLNDIEYTAPLLDKSLLQFRAEGNYGKWVNVSLSNVLPDTLSITDPDNNLITTKNPLSFLGKNSITLGQYIKIGDDSVAICNSLDVGLGGDPFTKDSVCIGSICTVIDSYSSVVIGHASSLYRCSRSVCIGYEASVDSMDGTFGNISIGAYAKSTELYSIAIGFSAHSINENSFVIRHEVDVDPQNDDFLLMASPINTQGAAGSPTDPFSRLKRSNVTLSSLISNASTNFLHITNSGEISIPQGHVICKPLTGNITVTKTSPLQSNEVLKIENVGHWNTTFVDSFNMQYIMYPNSNLTLMTQLNQVSLKNVLPNFVTKRLRFSSEEAYPSKDFVNYGSTCVFSGNGAHVYVGDPEGISTGVSTGLLEEYEKNNNGIWDLNNSTSIAGGSPYKNGSSIACSYDGTKAVVGSKQAPFVYIVPTNVSNLNDIYKIAVPSDNIIVDINQSGNIIAFALPDLRYSVRTYILSGNTWNLFQDFSLNFAKDLKLADNGNTLFIVTDVEFFVYKRFQSEWYNTITFTLPAANSVKNISTSYDGKIVYFGLPNSSANGVIGAGKVERYFCNNSVKSPAFVLQETLISLYPEVNGNFGFSTSTNSLGDLLYVGARGESSAVNATIPNPDPVGFPSGGKAYIALLQDNGLQIKTVLTSPNPKTSGMFGFSGSLSGDGRSLIIGAINEFGDDNDNSGAFYIYN